MTEDQQKQHEQFEQNLIDRNSKTTIGSAIGIGAIIVVGAFYLGGLLAGIEASLRVLTTEVVQVSERLDDHLNSHFRVYPHGKKP